MPIRFFLDCAQSFEVAAGLLKVSCHPERIEDRVLYRQAAAKLSAGLKKFAASIRAVVDGDEKRCVSGRG